MAAKLHQAAGAAAGQGPRHTSAAEECDEIPSPHGTPSGQGATLYHNAAIDGRSCAAQHLSAENEAMGQTRSFGDVGSSVRFARKRTRLDDL
jgi:hypothetical protein